MTLLDALQTAGTQQQRAGQVAAELSSMFLARGFTFPLALATGPGSGESVANAHALAERLLRHAGRVGTKRAAEDQMELLSRNRTAVCRLCAVWGILVPRAVQLTPQLQVGPLADYAASDAGKFFIPHEGVLDPQHHPKPRTVLALSRTLDPVYLQTGQRRAAFTYEDKWELRDFIDLLSLATARPTLWCGEWTEYPGASGLLGGGGWSGGLTDRLAIFEPTVTLTPQDTQRLARLALQLSPLRARLRTPLRRLNESHRREFASEKILDVGIALESLLTEDDDPTEGITHRLKVRVARLLGGTAIEREANAATIAKFYSLRSKVAHGDDIDSPLRSEQTVGKGAKALTAQDVEDLVAVVRQLCTRVVEAILGSGKWPSYKSMELGPN